MNSEIEIIDKNLEGKNLFNFALYFKKMVHDKPYKRAIIQQVGIYKKKYLANVHLTFLELDKESDCLANGLEKLGIVKGRKILLMIRPSLEYFITFLALIKIGAIPVIIDLEMNTKQILHSIKKASPEAVIAIPKIHFLKLRYREFFKTIRVNITDGFKWFWKGFTLKNAYGFSRKSYEIAKVNPDDVAFIYFSDVGPESAKGCFYTHDMLKEQLNKYSENFDLHGDEIDLPTLPFFALLNISIGITSLISKDALCKPIKADINKLVDSISNNGVTNIIASPTLFNRIGKFLENKGKSLGSLRKAITLGTEVYPSFLDSFNSRCSQHINVYTSYGDSNMSPILNISFKEILNETKQLTEQGFGICIGRSLDETDIRIIKISDNPIEKWSDELLVEDRDIGEIVISDELFNQSFYKKSKELFKKIKENDSFLRRTGHLGWKDKKGRIWYCGKKNQRIITDIGTLFTIPCESIFYRHPKVRRCALIGIGEKTNKIPVICIELKTGNSNINNEDIKKELIALAADNVQTKGITNFLFPKSFPIDNFHQLNISRKRLEQWAKDKL